MNSRIEQLEVNKNSNRQMEEQQSRQYMNKLLEEGIQAMAVDGLTGTTLMVQDTEVEETEPINQVDQ